MSLHLSWYLWGPNKNPLLFAFFFLNKLKAILSIERDKELQLADKKDEHLATF